MSATYEGLVLTRRSRKNIPRGGSDSRADRSTDRAYVYFSEFINAAGGWGKGSLWGAA